MNAEELKNICETDEFDDRIILESIQHINENNGISVYSVNEKVAVPIEEIALFYKTNNDVDILDADGTEIGRLCFRRHVTTISEFTDYQLIAYAHDLERHDNSGSVKLKKDYIVLPLDKYEDYIGKYYNTAPVWGHFSHESTNKNPYSVSIEKIIAEEKIQLPSDHHKETISRAVQQPFGFERFLKSYHMLELLFDHDLVSEIQSLGSDLKGIGKIMQEYSKKEEVYRLQKVITNRCNNIDKIVIALNRIRQFHSLAKEIFFDYGKDSNPIHPTSDKTAFEVFEALLLIDKPFEYDNVKQKINSVNNPDQFKSFIVKISTYLVYRIRCSIAHYKIGEYMMSYEDEEFIVKFAEPLLKQILIETFKVEDTIEIVQEVAVTT